MSAELSTVTHWIHWPGLVRVTPDSSLMTPPTGAARSHTQCHNSSPLTMEENIFLSHNKPVRLDTSYIFNGKSSTQT